MKKFIVLIFGVYCLASGIYKGCSNPADIKKNRECVILDKMKLRQDRDLLLIAKESNKNEPAFSINVSPATWSQIKVGEICYFKLSDFDINPRLDTYHTLNLFLIIVGFLGTIVGLLILSTWPVKRIQ